MIAMKASEIASVVQGQLQGDDVTVTQAAVINSLEATPGSLFLAIKGERVDGHDFVSDARSHGAVLTLSTQPVDGPHILVADVVIDLGKLAQHVRSNLLDLIVIGITGSHGKTTTKELLAAVGIEESGLGALIKKGYEILGLMTYFTTGEKETRAWTTFVGATAPQAGASIHSDFEHKFIRAEVIEYEKLLEAGSFAAAREKGWLRTEGKQYIVQDGDVIEFKI